MYHEHRDEFTLTSGPAPTLVFHELFFDKLFKMMQRSIPEVELKLLKEYVLKCIKLFSSTELELGMVTLLVDSQMWNRITGNC